MDLKQFDFPDVDDVEIVFGSECSIQNETFKTLLEEAKQRGFYSGNTKYNTLFSRLFFKGGTLNFKDGIEDKFITKAVRYMKSVLVSYQPKHEEKEAVCSLILSELVEP